jgi:Na+/H+ antiporter NhaD/arsenite permease-like protein
MQPSALPATSLAWGLPFLGILVSIALFPVVAPRFWRRHMGGVALAWSGALLVPLMMAAGGRAAAALAWHALLIDYLPFITLLLALYTLGGGVLLRGGPAGTPQGNTAMLALGMVMAAVMGTAGASMVLMHPLLRANAHRRQKVHLVLFLIVLVANAAGAISPLGNPPLYLGLLRGVPFFWPAHHLLAPLAVATALLLAAFYLIDRHLAAKEPPAPPTQRFRLRGWGNIALISLVIGAVFAVGYAPSGQQIGVAQFGAVAVFVAATALSAWLTPTAIRQANDFTWRPMLEVAMLFAGIFVTIAPVETMLRAGLAGPLAPLLRLTLTADGQPAAAASFWLAGMLSAFLDNAPTYLMFFDLAGIRADSLESQARVLTAISAGAVFFGGLTYIGNAPNMVIRAVAAHRGVYMPGFFGYAALASAVLLPVMALLTVLFFT